MLLKSISGKQIDVGLEHQTEHQDRTSNGSGLWEPVIGGIFPTGTPAKNCKVFNEGERVSRSYKTVQRPSDERAHFYHVRFLRSLGGADDPTQRSKSSTTAGSGR